MEDKNIVELFWARNETAIAEASAKYGRYCYTVSYNILSDGSDAEECINDAMLAAWNSIPPDRPKDLATYLGKIVRRISIDKWRKRTAAKRGGGEILSALHELEECIPSKSNVEAEVENKELAEFLSRFLLKLPKTERLIFIRRYWYLDRINDICEASGFTQSKVKSMLKRTRDKLRDELKKGELT